MPIRKETKQSHNHRSKQNRGGPTVRRHRNLRSKWSARRFRAGSRDGCVFVEFTFPTEEGGINQLRIPNSELRHHKRLLDQISDHLPMFPTVVEATDNAQIAFIREIASEVGRIDVLPDRTGFLDKNTFATYGEIIRADRTRTNIVRLGATQGGDYIDVKGKASGAKRDVLELARHSNYLAFAIGVALAAPLPSYVKFQSQDKNQSTSLISETAVFNFSGKSSAGKSSVCRAAMSLAGSPDRAGSFDFTSRGLAELASDSNDLLTVLDDTERAEDGSGVLVKALKSVVHMVLGGRSKLISRGADQSRFPNLRWSTFVLSSSPVPISQLAAERRWNMSPGDKVRLFDISVPGPKRGGIFDRISGTQLDRAERSMELIANLERGYSQHHGQIIPPWIIYLMQKNRSKLIVRLAEEFVQAVDAGRDGWEARFARKFGVVYAAMKLGIKAGLLPWPESLALAAAKKCYRKARNAAKTATERVSDAVERLHDLIIEDGRMVDASERNGIPIKMSRRCVAIRYVKDGRLKIGVLDSALLKLMGTRKAKTMLTSRLASAGLVRSGHGHAGTIQERLPIERNGEVVRRPRLWEIDAEEFAGFIQNKG